MNVDNRQIAALFEAVYELTGLLGKVIERDRSAWGYGPSDSWSNEMRDQLDSLAARLGAVRGV